MNAANPSWFAFGSEGTTRCAVCGACIDPEAFGLDHHPRTCPSCGVSCLLVLWKGRPAQLIPERAPEPIAELLRFAQQRFDELEFVELLCALEELADGAGASGNGAPTTATPETTQRSG
jgi:hypothetical protein